MKILIFCMKILIFCTKISDFFYEKSQLLRHGHDVLCDVEKEFSAEYVTIFFRLFQVLGFF